MRKYFFYSVLLVFFTSCLCSRDTKFEMNKQKEIIINKPTEMIDFEKYFIKNKCEITDFFQENILKNLSFEKDTPNQIKLIKYKINFVNNYLKKISFGVRDETIMSKLGISKNSGLFMSKNEICRTIKELIYDDSNKKDGHHIIVGYTEAKDNIICGISICYVKEKSTWNIACLYLCPLHYWYDGTDVLVKK